MRRWARGPVQGGRVQLSPGGSHHTQLPRGPERDPEETFFFHALNRGGGPHRERVPVRPTRAPGAPPRALTC